LGPFVIQLSRRFLQWLLLFSLTFASMFMILLSPFV
jgi:hypothetical protein